MQLLLPSAHTAILVTGKPSFFERLEKYNGALIVFGILVVLLGGLDLMSRIPTSPASNDTLERAFSPAVLLID